MDVNTVDEASGGQDREGQPHDQEEDMAQEAAREKYQKIVRCRLLPDIIVFLPYDQQLSVRKISSDWGSEATVALRQNLENGRIKIYDNQRMITFLSDFEATSGPMALLPCMTTEISPALIEEQQLSSFCIDHGARIGSLKISIPSESVLWMLSKAHHILECAENLQMLELKTLRVDFVQLNPPILPMGSGVGQTIAPLPTYQRLLELKFSGPVSQVPLLQEVLIASPRLRKITRFRLYETSALHPSTPDVVRRLQTFPFERIEMRMCMIPQSGVQDDTLLSLLQFSQLSSRHVTLFLRGGRNDRDPEQNFQRERARRQLCSWLSRMSLSHWPIQSLQLRCSTLTTTEVIFPVLKELVTLNLGIKVEDEQNWDMFGGVIPRNPIAFAQIPNVSTILISNVGEILNSDDSYPPVTILIVQDLEQGSRNRGPYWFPPTARWSSMFPNLHTLETFVVHGHEDDLAPVLRDLTTLQNLEIRFENFWRLDHNGLWEVLTGIPQQMDLQTPTLVLLPGPVSNPPALAPGISSLQKLANLKTLKLINSLPTVILAIAHLTSLGLLPSYEHLQFNTLRVYKYTPDPSVAAALLAHHGRVDFQ